MRNREILPKTFCWCIWSVCHRQTVYSMQINNLNPCWKDRLWQMRGTFNLPQNIWSKMCPRSTSWSPVTQAATVGGTSPQRWNDQMCRRVFTASVWNKVSLIWIKFIYIWYISLIFVMEDLWVQQVRFALLWQMEDHKVKRVHPSSELLRFSEKKKKCTFFKAGYC